MTLGASARCIRGGTAPPDVEGYTGPGYPISPDVTSKYEGGPVSTHHGWA